MNTLHTFWITICVVATRSSAGYEVINNEIIERINLDNGQDLQLLSTSAKKEKIKHHVEAGASDELGNSVQESQASLGLTGQPSIIYAAIQAIPQSNSDAITTPTPLETQKPREAKPYKPEDPSEDKSKNIKTKLFSYMKQPKAPNIETVEIANSHDSVVEEMNVATVRTVVVQPYATIIDDEKDLKAEQSEEPYVVYDKQDYLKPKHVRKTVKTHKMGDEKKSVYPKQEVRAPKDDLETDNTIWIGYGLGAPVYRYPYNYPNYPMSLYGNNYYYGRPYSGWQRGYTGPYYDSYRTNVQSGYTGSAYNNYGTGYGSYGGYL